MKRTTLVITMATVLPCLGLVAGRALAERTEGNDMKGKPSGAAGEMDHGGAGNGNGNGKAQRATQQKDIVETAMQAGNFATLITALRAAGMVDVLKSQGPFTVFAPTDEAFAKLPPGTVEDLLKPENREQLRTILSYHVVPGEVTSTQITKMNSAKTVEGATLPIKAQAGTVRVGNARVVKPDIDASNGVIHAIDNVLMPSR